MNNLIQCFKKHTKDILLLSSGLFYVVFHIRKINGQDVFEVLRPLRFMILIIVIGFIGFVFVPQGLHAMKALKNFEGNISKSLCVILALIYWSFQLYYGARMILKLSNIRYTENTEERIYGYFNYTPIILGTFPFFIIALSYIRSNGFYDFRDWILMAILTFLNLLITTVHYKKTLEDSLVYHPNSRDHASLVQSIRREFTFNEFTPEMRRWFRFLIITFFSLFTFFTCASLTEGGIGILQFIGPTAIVITGLAAWVSLATAIIIVNLRFFRFASLVVLGLFIFSSDFNDNHAITPLKSPFEPQSDVAAHFENWKKTRQIDTNQVQHYPVFVIAAEGGGSRSAYWSGTLLAALCDTLPALKQHLFAISAVSGGSLGTGVFTAGLRKQLFENEKVTAQQIKEILKKDFLSPVTASLMFPDFFQHFIPFKIPSFDRARALERSWESAFSHVIPAHTNPLKMSFEDFWRFDTSCQIPSLFFNSTMVNTGKRTIISNLKLNAPKFSDALALRDTIGQAISISQAISLSARFPYITPSGIVHKPDGTYWGAVVDGGYFDNSGILTALEIINILKENKTQGNIIFDPYLIIISNYSNFHDTNQYNEFTEPIMAAFNRTFGGSISYARARVGKEINKNRIIEFPLQANAVDVPLGWYLSESSIKVMNYRVETVVKEQVDYFRKLIAQ